MEPTQRLTVTLVVDPDSVPVSGLMTIAAGTARPFVGWMDLVQALERLRAGADAPPPGAPQR